MQQMTVAGIAVAWIARETIYVGQMLIRIAYGWGAWAERHVTKPDVPTQ